MAEANAVANRFLALAAESGNPLTPMQLLKLVYIAHGWNLGLYGAPLIEEEIQAWRYGPVIPDLYNSVRQYRSNPVRDSLQIRRNNGLDPRDQDLVDQVYRIYGGRTGIELSKLTHAVGTPWHRTYRAGEFGIAIPNDIIEDHYAQLARVR